MVLEEEDGLFNRDLTDMTAAIPPVGVFDRGLAAKWLDCKQTQTTWVVSSKVRVTVTTQEGQSFLL